MSHRHLIACRELRDTWERAEENKPSALRRQVHSPSNTDATYRRLQPRAPHAAAPCTSRQVYSLSNTDAKYRSRALMLHFLLDHERHRKKVILDYHYYYY